MAWVNCSSVTLILFFSPISAMHETKPHPPLGDGAILRARLFLGRAFVGKGAALLLEVVLDLRPDVVEFLFDQRRRRLEFVPRVELVEQRALDLLARRAGVLALDALAHGVAQLGERFQSERLGELVVERDRAGRFHRLCRDRKGRVFAGDGGRRIVFGKFHVEGPAFAGFDADELILEARNELAGAEHHRHVLAGAALEGLAVHRALERHGDAIALLRRLGLGGERPVLLGDASAAH